MRVRRLIQRWLGLGAVLAMGAGALCAETKTLKSTGGNPVAYEEYGPSDAALCVVLLYGSSGTAMALYGEQARFLGEHGFHVLMPHYFDATRATVPSTANYRVWAAVVRDFAGECRKTTATQKVFAIGFSLGASVALAAGSQGTALDGIAEWYGSLPDDFFYEMKGMPPLLILHGERDANIPVTNGQQLVKLCEMKRLRCSSHFYPDQGHGFMGEALRDADERTLAFFAELR